MIAVKTYTLAAGLEFLRDHPRRKKPIALEKGGTLEIQLFAPTSQGASFPMPWPHVLRRKADGSPGKRYPLEKDAT